MQTYKPNESLPTKTPQEKYPLTASAAVAEEGIYARESDEHQGHRLIVLRSPTGVAAMFYHGGTRTLAMFGALGQGGWWRRTDENVLFEIV